MQRHLVQRRDWIVNPRRLLRHYLGILQATENLALERQCRYESFIICIGYQYSV